MSDLPSVQADSSSRPQYTKFYTPENEVFYNSFHYQSLDKENEEIRLLQIDLSRNSDLRNHKMIDTVPLSHVGKYSAISYHSGDPTRTRKISINNIEMNIFETLAEGIDAVISHWQREFPGQELMLWVDQICINQSDAAEKSQQVNFMREIYRRATYVHVSMLLDHDISPAINWLERLCTEASRPPQGYIPLTNMLYQNVPDEYSYRDEWPANVWQRLDAVVSHPWWGRAWIYQEFIVATQVVLLFSKTSSVKWEKFEPLLSLFLKMDTLEAAKDALKNFTWVKKTRKKYGCLIDEKRPCHKMTQTLGCLYCLPVKSSTYGDCGHRYCLWIIHHSCEALCYCCGRCYWNDRKARWLGKWLCFSPCILVGAVGCLLDAGASAVVTTVARSLYGCHFCPCYGYDMKSEPPNILGLRRHLDRLPGSGFKRDLVVKVMEGRVQWQKLQYSDLSFLLHHARNTETSHPKDKVYAFLGLAHPKYAIPVNYDINYSMNALLCDVAHAIIKHESTGLNILAQAGIAAHDRQLQRDSNPLPSWVPDWDVKDNAKRKSFLDALELPEDCAAGLALQSSVSFSPDRYGNSGRTLHVTGIRVGTLGSRIATTEETETSIGVYRSVDDQSEISTTIVASIGDELWILNGVRWPVVLRRSTTRNSAALLAIAMVRVNGQPHPMMSDGLSGSQEEEIIIS